MAVLGEKFSRRPDVFDEARQRLGDKVVQYGYVSGFAEYARWLWRADILPVTSCQDFFGLSVLQAMHCNTWPLLPRRLAYPEHIPEPGHDKYFYNDFDDLVKKTMLRIRNIRETRQGGAAPFAAKYDWSGLVGEYDDELEKLRPPGQTFNFQL